MEKELLFEFDVTNSNAMFLLSRMVGRLGRRCSVACLFSNSDVVNKVGILGRWILRGSSLLLDTRCTFHNVIRYA